VTVDIGQQPSAKAPPYRPEWDTGWDEAFRGKYPKPPPTISVNGLAVDCQFILLPVQILHGRSEFNVQPQAPSLSFSIIGPVPWKRNDAVTVTLLGFSRFQGYITGMTATYREDQFVTDVECVGWQARGGTIYPSWPPMPVEDDVTRAQRYLSVFSSSFPPWIGSVRGTETTDLVAQDVDGGSDVLSRLWDVCKSTGALLFQNRDGNLVYGTASHRTAVGLSYYIDNCDILDGVQWVNDGATLVNKVTVKYGPLVALRKVSVHTTDGIPVVSPYADRYEYVETDAPSIALEGPKDVSVDSLIQSEQDAVLFAKLILFRRVTPYWALPGGIVVNSDDMDDPAYDGLLKLDISDAVMVKLSREPEAPENLVEWIVEGWVEEWNEQGGHLVHTMKMALSDRQRFGLTGIRTVAELAAGFTVDTAKSMTIRNAMFKPI
jgi:hypothetical protein